MSSNFTNAIKFQLVQLAYYRRTGNANAVISTLIVLEALKIIDQLDYRTVLIDKVNSYSEFRKPHGLKEPAGTSVQGSGGIQGSAGNANPAGSQHKSSGGIQGSSFSSSGGTGA